MKSRYLPVTVLLLGSLVSSTQAQNVGTCAPSIGEALLDVGNVRARILNNGNLFWRGSPHVYEVPKGGGANAIFASGIWVGGLVEGQLRLAGSTYGPFEFWAGPLDEDGLPPADCSVFDRVFKISRSDLAVYENGATATPDLLDWPTGLGAPTLDRNGEPIELLSQPLIERVDRVINLGAGERPDITGDQMLWWVLNDRGNVHMRSDAPPLGIEMHVSAFAFNVPGGLGNTTFYRYKLFYKGTKPTTGTYFGVFSDPDLGNFSDDWVGSDSVLNLGYVYNADNFDEGVQGYGEAPPAVGYKLLEVSGGDEDSLDSGVDSLPKRGLMTSFMYYSGGAGVAGDPISAPDMYNYMRSRWKDGLHVTYGGNGRDSGGPPTNYVFSGNPPEFWSEANHDGLGTAISPADRRFVVANGPFEMKPEEAPRQFTVAIITSFGADNLDSVQRLKRDSEVIQTFSDAGFALADPPDAPVITTTRRSGEVLIEWTNNEESNNYQDSYSAVNTTILGGLEDRNYRFEGYNLLEFESPSDQKGRLLAVFDVINGVKQVIAGDSIRFPIAFGTDSGVQHSLRIQGLTNYRTYLYGVQAYAYNANSRPQALFGPVIRFEVVPAVSKEEGAPPLRIGITPNPYKGASDYEVSSITDEVRFTNMPEQATIRVFQLSGTLVRTLVKNSREPFITWNLRTDNNLPIGSGLYIIHVETEAGDQVIKFGVVKKQVFLNAK
ncbi:MAG: hypothetical protein ACI80V_000262 [Rhodothermales bacterium]|jgi:hypothetical protein